jgi:predicted cupin superfamily sugar epimerase
VGLEPRCHRRAVSATADRPPVAEALDLAAHPEGGWFRRTWTAAARAALDDGRDRAAASAILFHLPVGTSSAWHRVSSEELWCAQVGHLTLELGGAGPAPAEAVEVVALGLDPGVGQEPQLLVPAGVWQRTRPASVDVLVTCVVSPEFSFADFELGPEA